MKYTYLNTNGSVNELRFKNQRDALAAFDRSYHSYIILVHK